MRILITVGICSLSGVAASSTHSRLPFCIARGGSSEGDLAPTNPSANAAMSIPMGGASYSSQLEGVKASILETAAGSVSYLLRQHATLCLLTARNKVELCFSPSIKNLMLLSFCSDFEHLYTLKSLVNDSNAAV